MGTVSHSEVDSYLLCRRKHYYGYGLSLQRVSESHSLAMGSAGHKILETFYNAIGTGESVETQLKSFDFAYGAALDMYNQVVAEGFEEDSRKASLHDTLFNEGYGYFSQEPFVKNKYEILAVEQDFNLLYDEENDSHYPFVVDLIVRDPDGKIIVVDHKFVYDFYTPEATDMQPQIPKYIGALRALGHEVSHGAYNMLRTRKIKEPTPEQMNHFMLLKPNTTRVKATFLEQIHVADELQALKTLPIEKQDERAYRVANKMVCQSCSFRDLCSTELVGGNVELMLRTEYKVRERKQFTETSEQVTKEK
jgi:CRISPR/Cas system-associated exonuclease Cas4 (RecB family)